MQAHSKLTFVCYIEKIFNYKSINKLDIFTTHFMGNCFNSYSVDQLQNHYYKKSKSSALLHTKYSEK